MVDSAFHRDPVPCILIVEDEYLIAMDLAELVEGLKS